MQVNKNKENMIFRLIGDIYSCRDTSFGTGIGISFIFKDI